MAANIPATYTLAQDQRKAIQRAKNMTDAENHGAVSIEAQDSGKEAGYVIYVYNLLNRDYVVQQPPLFPGFHIPACKPGQRFSFTILPAFVKETYVKPGTTEFYYKTVDGRKVATSLLNPSAFPGTNWDSQIQKWDTPDQTGNNLNLFGVWWSLTKPDETEKLDREIKIFKDRVGNTMNELIREAEGFNATGELKLISPLMHFAMDYLGKQAGWHMTHKHMITCPNCGDPVQDGISYHRNSFGDRCIIDRERYEAAIAPAPKAIPGDDEEEEIISKPKKLAKAGKA